MEDAPLPPLPKRPTVIRGASHSQPEPPGAGTNEDPTNTVPSPRVPVRPAPPKPGGPPKQIGGPPKPGSRPASVHVPSKKPSPNFLSEKSNGGSTGKRKIEITIVDARPMSEIGFRDIEGPVTKPPPSPKSPPMQAHNSSSAEESNKPKPSVPAPETSPPPLPSRSEEIISSLPVLDGSDNSKKSLPSKPKRPTIIRAARPVNTDEEASQKGSLPVTLDKEQNDNTAPKKSPRLPKAVPTSESFERIQNESPELKSRINQEDDCELHHQVESDIPVAPAKPKRPTIIRPGKPIVQDLSVEDKTEVEKDNTLSLPSRPPRPSSSKPPPLPSRSPASSHPASPPSSVESVMFSPQAPQRPSETSSSDRRPLPKPRPRSVAASSSVLSFPPTDDLKDSPTDGKKKDTTILSPTSPPALPVKAPRPASSFMPPSTTMASSEKDDTKISSHEVRERKSQERMPPARPKPRTPTESRKVELPPRPSAPPAKKTSDSDPHSLQDVDNTYETIDSVTVQRNEKFDDTSSVSEKASRPKETKTLSEISNPNKEVEKEEMPIYSKINKPIKRHLPEKAREEEADKKDGEKSVSFPFNVKLKSTLSQTGESKEDSKISEREKSSLQSEENDPPPIIAPKLKPKPSAKPKPQPAVKPKPTSPKENEARTTPENGTSKPQESQKKETVNIDQKEESHNNLSVTATNVEKTELDLYSEIQDERMNKSDQNSNENMQSPPEKSLPPLPSKRPVRMLGRPPVRKTENDSKLTDNGDKSQQGGKVNVQDDSVSTSKPVDPSLKDNSLHSSVKQNPSNDGVEHDPSSAKVPQDQLKDPDERDPSSIPARKKPVRIIGFPQRSSTVEKEKGNTTGNDKDIPPLPERSSHSIRPPPPRPASRPLPLPPAQTGSDSVNSGTKPMPDPDVIADEGNLNVPPQVAPSSTQLEDRSMEKRREKIEEMETEGPVERSSPPSKRPAPAARPPPPRKTSNASLKSTSLSTTDYDPNCQEKHLDDPDQTDAVSEKNKEEVVEKTTETLDKFQSSGSQEPMKPPRSGLPPPRPSSAARRKGSEPSKDRNQNEKTQESITERPPRPQPSRPLPPKSDKGKSAGPPALPARPGPGHILYNYIANQPHGIALHDYTGGQPDELSFQAGETVILTKQVDDQWLCGRVGDKEGIFPGAFSGDEMSIGIEEMETEGPVERSSPPSKRPAPAARPPPPRKTSNASLKSTSLSTTDYDPNCQEKHLDDPDQTDAVSEKNKEEVVEKTTETLDKFQSSGSQEPMKPPRSGLPPPRPSSAARRKGSEPSKDRNQNEKTQESITERPPRPQPSRPLPPKSDKGKSAGPPALPARPGPGHILYNYIANQPHGIALHDYTGGQPDELSFQAGETVILTKQVDDQWLCGRVGDKEGIFPGAFLEMKCPLELKGAAASSASWQEALDDWPPHDDVNKFDVEKEKPDNIIGPRCRARFDFEGCGEGELVLEDGDVIKLLSHVGNEWLKGELNGCVGIFPSAYVEIIEDLPDNTDAKEESPSSESVAIFDFDGQEGDLSFQAGDSIHLLGHINTEWLYGECNGNKGQFPTAFISSVPSGLPTFDPSSLATDAENSTIQSLLDSPDHFLELSPPAEKSPQPMVAICVAVHDYDSDTAGDLQFKSGDRIEIIEFVGDDWLSGRLQGVEGMFPKAFVEMEDYQPSKKTEPEEIFGKAVHTFNGHDDTELTFEEGSVIQLENFVDENQEWRFGTFEGRRGMFPSAFVEPV